jgi:exopolyphosphatase/pppGpp-phosphohydrolase
VTAPSIGAAIDLGSNSVHLLVAAIDGHALRPLADQSAFLGLGTAVDGSGHLGPERRADLAAALAGYAATASGLGAVRLTLIGTEPIRRAADAVRVVREVESATGVPLHVISHEEEAYLTLIGATSGWPVSEETVAVDIGGGSSEFCVVAPGEVARAAGLPLGSGRLTGRHVRSDPPTSVEIAGLRAAAEEVLRRAPSARPTDLLAVGGTAANVAKLASVDGPVSVLTREAIAEVIATTTQAPAAEISARFAVNPKRGPLLPAGAVIIEALMRRYDVERVRVSDAGIREGAVLVADHAGRAWRDRLPALAHGWRVERRTAPRPRS